MNIMRSRKALSPVVASVILIAATVAVSIAVAVWSGALTFSFMNNGEQLKTGSPYGWRNGNSVVNLDVRCSGGNTVSIVAVRINGVNCLDFSGTLGLTIGPNNSTTVTAIYPPTFLSGYFYTIVITTARNNEFQTTGVVP